LIPRKWTKELIILKSKAEELSGTSYNSVLLNYYRDGADSMGWHSDDEKELGVNPAIASVTFGYPRRFLIRERKEHKNKKEISLEDNSILVMYGDFQEKYQHSIPKTTRKIGERINLTFRKIII
jgi:alkylated DNA repair dioxygenase AlkB